MQEVAVLEKEREDFEYLSVGSKVEDEADNEAEDKAENESLLQWCISLARASMQSRRRVAPYLTLSIVLEFTV